MFATKIMFFPPPVMLKKLKHLFFLSFLAIFRCCKRLSHRIAGVGKFEYLISKNYIFDMDGRILTKFGVDPKEGRHLTMPHFQNPKPSNSATILVFRMGKFFPDTQ